MADLFDAVCGVCIVGRPVTDGMFMGMVGVM